MHEFTVNDRRFEDESFPDEELQRPRWLWPVFVVLAWLAFELTANPTVSAVVLCLKFGWKEWLVAFWLFYRDPRRVRGVGCCLLYFAAGGWRVCWATFLTMIAVSIIAAFLNIPIMEVNLTMLLLGIVSVILVAPPLILGVFTVWWWQLPVWLSRRTYDVLWNWPPRPGGENALPHLFWPLMVVLVGLSVTAMVALMSQLPMAKNDPRATVAFGLGFLAMMFGAPVLAFVVRDRVLMRLSALTPEYCWPPDTEDGSWIHGDDSFQPQLAEEGPRIGGM